VNIKLTQHIQYYKADSFVPIAECPVLTTIYWTGSSDVDKAFAHTFREPADQGTLKVREHQIFFRFFQTALCSSDRS